MALPYPGSPNIGQLVRTMISNIGDNFNYLDANPTAYCIKYFTKTISSTSRNSYETVTGVGFKPRIILLLVMGGYGDACIGYYGPSTGANKFSIYKERRLSGGAYSSDRYKTYVGTYITSLWLFNDTAYNYTLGYVYSINDDGFVFRWVEGVKEVIPETYYAVALCIK